VLLIESHV